MTRRICIPTTCIIFIGLLMPKSTHGGTTRYVKDGGTGDGSSWTDAYGDLQQALAVSLSFDQIWVASGTYSPGDDSSDTFELIDEVQVYGGFYGTPGTEGDPYARDPDPATNNTVLSGNLGTNGNSSVVVTATGVYEQTILDGFTITGGIGGHDGSGNGAGVYVGYPCTATFRNCLIVGNRVPDSGSGAGMYMTDGCRPTLESCTFQENRGGTGAGMFIMESDVEPVVRKCKFIANVAVHDGGGVFNDSYGDLILYDCIFVGNEASDGGGLSNGFYSNVELVNCLFSGNTALDNGGAIDQGGNILTLRNCSLHGNSCICGDGGGVHLQYGDPATLVNSIFWGNSDSEGSGETAQIRIVDGTPSITYCCIEGRTGGGTGNINNDPVFIDADGTDNVLGTLDDNLRLVPGSDCIDTGSNGAVMASRGYDATVCIDDPIVSDDSNINSAGQLFEENLSPQSPVLRI